ncbi:ribosomal protein S18 acetylase RimI-like enzyme [Sphingomonas trueperi]|uniref:Ribosomal protein S18 acetylase RimI-like enzyme n=1 Tax=Sphingomonas trueperi TaxID=53317 RepID=A0A7X5Y333_9SPHN|nr:ribosomal protein S18 acetylase RimI-like enzyme [Sphingomonas trueperi]
MIRPAVRQDGAAIWAILEPVIRAGETYALDRDMSRDDALAYWLGPDRASFVAEGEGRVLGTYYLRANQAGGGAHVANCGYATHPEARGRGIARAMAEHSFTEARARGFRAMQFNFVVSSNAPAVRLWHALGFATVGRVPEAFEHPAQGLVDALVLYRPL